MRKRGKKTLDSLQAGHATSSDDKFAEIDISQTHDSWRYRKIKKGLWTDVVLKLSGRCSHGGFFERIDFSTAGEWPNLQRSMMDWIIISALQLKHELGIFENCEDWSHALKVSKEMKQNESYQESLATKRNSFYFKPNNHASHSFVNCTRMTQISLRIISQNGRQTT